MDVRASCRLILLSLAALALSAPMAARADGLFGGKSRTSKDAEALSGNLAVIDLRVHEITTPGANPRLVIQTLVENQTPVDRTTPFELRLRLKDARHTLGACRGAQLPQGCVALCELWLDNEAVRQGDVFEAALDRTVGDLGGWDADPSDDRRTHELRTIAEGGQILRLSDFGISPERFQGPTELQFRFQVEGAHLVWLLAEDRPPRLLAGHPADGLLTGKGRERVNSSGPLTLVARNSFGAFVYQTVPVFNTAELPAAVQWSRVPVSDPGGVAEMRVLEPGVYDIDEDQAILINLRTYLAAKDWAAVQPPIKLDDGRPRPASALNPKSRPTPEPANDDAPPAKRKRKR